MNRNLSLPQISSSPQKNSKQYFQFQSPSKSNNHVQSLSQFSFSNEDTKLSSSLSPMKIKKKTMSETKLPTIQQKSVIEMQEHIQSQDEKLRQKILKEQDEIATILLQDNHLIIQPKFFEKKGSMCTTELWSGSLKKEFLLLSQQEVLFNSNGTKKLKLKKVPKENRKGNMPEVEKLLANIYRPEKMKNQAEMNRILEDLKQGVEISKQSIEQQIKHFENRTPLDIKVRMLQKKMNTDANQEDDDDYIPFKKTESEERNQNLKKLPLKDDLYQRFEEYGIEEVEDEGLESTPKNDQQDYSDEEDQIKEEEKQKKENSPSKNNYQIGLKYNKNGISAQSKLLSPSKKSIQMSRNINKNNNYLRGRKIQSEKDIISLSNIPTNYNDDSFENGNEDEITQRNKNEEFMQQLANMKTFQNPELNQYVNVIKNVIEECNQNLETNAGLSSQLKKHTKQLNNRSKNFKSVANLEKRIQSSTIF